MTMATVATPTAPTLPDAPEQLVENGEFNLGVFGTAFRRVNFGAARVDRGSGGGWFGRRRLIEFQHFAIGNGRFHVSVALFDTKGVGQAQVSIYDRETRKKYRHERKTAPWELALAQTVWDGESTFRRGQFKIQFRNGLARGEHWLDFYCPGKASRLELDALPEVEGHFLCHETEASPRAVVCLPFGGGAAMYSHKGVIPAEGRLRIGGEEYVFDRDTSYAMTDIHKGYYPNPLRWNWAAGAGFDAQGQLIGFNLTRNQVLQPDRYNECWLLANGVIERLPISRFQIEDGSDLSKGWRIQDDEGRVDIEFHPEVSHSIDLNVLLMQSRYRGPYGHFSGHLLTANGEAVDVSTCFGMAEDFFLRG